MIQIISSRPLCHGLRKIVGTYFRREKSSKVNLGLEDVLGEWSKRLKAGGVPDADSSAELIAAHVLGRKTLHNVNRSVKSLSKPEKNAIDKLCELRLQRMPVQYILGEWDFLDLTLQMQPPVFIPRPETEELVVYCTEVLAASTTVGDTARFLELCCGSGAISLALLHSFHKFDAVCVDKSVEACKLTGLNAKAVGVDSRIQVLNQDFLHSRAFQALLDRGPFSFLISNPPYVTEEEMRDLAPEIKHFEDVCALDGGQDGLDLVKPILDMAARLVLPGGHIFLEVGENHPKWIEEFVGIHGKDLCLDYVATIKDINDRDRISHLQVL